MHGLERRTAAALLAALALGACGGGGDGGSKGSDNEYPASARTNFMNACVAQPGAKRSACQCAFDRIQSRLTFAEFKSADAAVRRGEQMKGKARSVFADAVKACMSS